MKRVLLLGGGGFLGRNIREALKLSGSFVATLDALPTPNSVDHVQLALSQTKRICELLDSEGFDVVIHLASSLLPSSALADFQRECEQVMLPTARLLEACAARRVRFVLISSGGTIYGNCGLARIPESQTAAPGSYYAYSKLMLEEAVLLQHRAMDLQYLILRPSNPYGRYQRTDGSQGLVAVAIGKLLRGQVLEIWGDGNVVRDYIDVRDLSSGVVALLRAAIVNKTINIGSGVGSTINLLVATIEHVTGRTLPVKYVSARQIDIPSVVLDTTQLSSIIKWAPRPLKQGVEDFYHHLVDSDGR